MSAPLVVAQANNIAWLVQTFLLFRISYYTHTLFYPSEPVRWVYFNATASEDSQ